MGGARNSGLLSFQESFPISLQASSPKQQRAPSFPNPFLMYSFLEVLSRFQSLTDSFDNPASLVSLVSMFENKHLSSQSSSSGAAAGQPPSAEVVLAVRLAVGLTLGLSDGLSVGLTLGLSDGRAVGLTLGLSDGLAVGLTLGLSDGLAVVQTSTVLVRKED